MKAVILAAGQGTRMRPLTLNTPKPLIELAGQPIIKHIIEALPAEIDEIIMVVDYLKEMIVDNLGKSFTRGKIAYVTQSEKSGTYGALLSAKDLLPEKERFLVINGDDLHNKSELEKLLEFPLSFGVQMTMMPNYYAVVADDCGHLHGFRDQNDEEKKTGAMVATGAYVLNTDIFDVSGVEIAGKEYGLPQTILLQKDVHPIKVVEMKKWIPLNSPGDIQSAELQLKKKH